MLRRLSVENYALIDKLDIEFAQGLNIITGETGAGKSILLGALSLILGSRGDSGAVKDPARNCIVEGEFAVDGYGLEPLFEEIDVDYEPVTVIRRIINTAGKSRAYINDIPVQLASLREVGDRLIDVHSQHQTLLLGDGKFQIRSIDSVASNYKLLAQYEDVYTRLKNTEKLLAAIKERSAAASKDREFITYQLEQLHAAMLKDGEQEELEASLNELEHASEIKEVLLYASDVLGGGDEDDILSKLKGMELSVSRLRGVFPAAEEYTLRLKSVLLELKDLYSEMSLQGDRVEADNGRLEAVRERLDTLYSLQQKHKVSSVAELIDIRTGYEAQLKDIEGFGDDIERYTREITELGTSAAGLAADLTRTRREAAVEVEKYVVGMLSKLGMPASQLKIEITPAAVLQPDGADIVKFTFSANKNSPLLPIEKVASGGEMSRLMLALKSLLAGHSRMPTIIFDEIDSGVSGSIADKMGEIICSLASDIQIINITHLPQVASKGDTHFFVYKTETSDSTVTAIRCLSYEERIEEIAKMISGSDVTDAARQQARLLLDK